MYLWGVNLGILGGGFGIYGYLPAAIQNGYRVITLSKYAPIIQSRAELLPYVQEVNFVESETELLKLSANLVIARDPNSQTIFLDKYAGEFNHLFLEKPLGQNVVKQQESLQLLQERKQPFSVGYLAPYTNWFEVLDKSHFTNISIVWECKLNSHSWKTRMFEDQGLLSFYGAHMVPMIELLGMDLIDRSVNWGKNAVKLNFETATNTLEILLLESDKSSFKVYTNEIGSLKPLYELETPFGTSGRVGFPDARIELLRRHLKSSLENLNQELYITYEEIFICLRTRLKQNEL